MNKIKSFLLKLKDRLYSAIKRYPIAVLLLLFAAAMIMVTIDINSNNKPIGDELFIRLAMTALYGAVLSLVIKSAAERFEFTKLAEWLTYLAVPASMALVFYLLIPDYDSMVVMIKYLLLCLLTAALFFFIPFIKSDKSASYFAQKVLLRLAVTMVYYGIITGGVEAIIFAVENLLSVAMPDEIYMQTAVCLAGLFIPAFFFAGIPGPGDTQESYPKLIKILLHYIVYPLLAAYTLVLYAYFIKILIEWQLRQQPFGQPCYILFTDIGGRALFRPLHKKREPLDTIVLVCFPVCADTAHAHDAAVVYRAHKPVRIHRTEILRHTVRDIRTSLYKHNKAAKEGAHHTSGAFDSAACFHIRAAVLVQRFQMEPEQAL